MYPGVESPRRGVYCCNPRLTKTLGASNLMNLSPEDISTVVRLVAEANAPAPQRSIPTRKRQLLEQVTQLVDADVFLWSKAVTNPELAGDSMTTSLIDGGWESDAQRAAMYEALTNLEFTTATVSKLTHPEETSILRVLRRSDFVSEEIWEKHRAPWDRTGLDYSLMSMFSLGGNRISGIGLHRRRGKPDFTERELTIARLVFSNVECLHREETEHSLNATVLRLSARERQVLILILGGESIRDISRLLDISEHTVGDYTKKLHDKFHVSSRAELQALFFLGRGEE